MVGFAIDQLIDLSMENAPRLYRQPLASGDSGAHTWVVRIVRGGAAVDLTGCTATLNVRRDGDSDEATLRKEATIAGNRVSCELPRGVYELGGQLTAVMVVEDSAGRVVTAAVLLLRGKQYITDHIADPDGTLPSVRELTRRVAAMESTVSQLKDDLSAEQTARKSADNVLTARMDAFTALPDGSTTGDAELADIRVGADGTTYPTAGDAVRGQIGAVNGDLATIGAQCSDYKEISGYDVNTGYRWGLSGDGKSQLVEYSNGTAYEIDVKSGEKYKISGYTNSDTTHSILFGNAEGVYTRFTGYATPPVSDYEITIPNGIVKMHITALLVDRYGFAVKKYMIAKSAITEDGLKNLTYTKSEIDAILGEGTLPDYYYEDGWMQSKIDNINAMAENVENGVSFCWFTDLHFLYNAKNSKYLLKEIRRNTPVEYVFCGGDFVWAYGDKAVLKDAEVEWQQYRDCIGPRNVFTIRGNHDFTIRTSQTETTGYTATETETYSYISKKMEQEGISIRPGRNYYYVDNSAQKVRFICIDEFSIHNQGTTDAYWDLLPAIPQEQYDWIINDALNVSDYTIVFMAHGACDPEIYAAMGNLKPLRDLLNSFRNKTSINQTYANGIILNHDFSNDTNTLACFICGHGHKDQSHEENGVLTIATAADYRSGDDTVTREFGTVSEQAIDVFTINTQDRTIKTVRVGGGEDREWTY